MKSLLNKKNVVGYAKGEKWTNGKPTGEKAMLVFVEKKEPLSSLNAEDVIENHINGLVTDVVGKTGKITALKPQKDRFTLLNKRLQRLRNILNLRNKHRKLRNTNKKKRILKFNPKTKRRPILGGISISHRNVTAGTLGCIFKDKDQDIILLSNNHVIANNNEAKINDAVYQPGVYDSSPSPKNIIGHLKNFIELKNNANQDSAIAKINTKNLGSYINYLGKPNGFSKAKMGMKVKKSGRTSQAKTGQIIGINGIFRIWYNQNTSYIIKNIIVTTQMSSNGDSGSVLLDHKNKICGLLFAGSNTVTLHNPIQNIIKAYGPLTII